MLWQQTSHIRARALCGAGGVHPRWVLQPPPDHTLYHPLQRLWPPSSFMSASGPVPKRYVVTALFAATLFITAFERLNGYRLKQLSRLDWQLRNSVSIWFVIVLLLTTVAFFLKMSVAPCGWALAWINIGALALFAWRTIFHFASARWLRDGVAAVLPSLALAMRASV